MDKVLRSSVPVVVVDRGDGAVDGELLKVGTSVSVQLSVEIGKDASLKQRVIGEVDAAHDVARLELYSLATDKTLRRGKHTMICSVSAK